MLKLGVLLIIIIGPVILLAYASFLVGDYSHVEPDVSASLLNELHDAMGYTILYAQTLSLLLFGLGKTPAPGSSPVACSSVSS